MDIVLLKFLIFLRGFRRAFAPRVDAWIQDGLYQLQRRAYEAHGQGEWEHLDVEIPVVKHKTDLVDLPLESTPGAIPCQCKNVADQTPTLVESPTGSGATSVHVPLETVAQASLGSQTASVISVESSTAPVMSIQQPTETVVASESNTEQLASTAPAEPTPVPITSTTSPGERAT